MVIDVCLEAVFPKLSYEKRIARIAACGFRAVEFWFHDWTAGATKATSGAKDAKVLRQACAASKIAINNMVVNAPDGSRGGALVAAGDRTRYLDRLAEVIAFAKECGCSKAITCAGQVQSGLTRARMRANMVKTLGLAAEIAEREKFTLFLEPLNTTVDHAGYYLDSSTEGAAVIREIGSKNVRLLFDVYHMQIMEGNVTTHIEQAIDVIGHFHSAGVPGRHELMEGELQYPYILKRIQSLGYKGAFGLEYFPALADHAVSLKKTRTYLNA